MGSGDAILRPAGRLVGHHQQAQNDPGSQDGQSDDRPDPQSLAGERQRDPLGWRRPTSACSHRYGPRRGCRQKDGGRRRAGRGGRGDRTWSWRRGPGGRLPRRGSRRRCGRRCGRCRLRGRRLRRRWSRCRSRLGRRRRLARRGRLDGRRRRGRCHDRRRRCRLDQDRKERNDDRDERQQDTRPASVWRRNLSWRDRLDTVSKWYLSDLQPRQAVTHDHTTPTMTMDRGRAIYIIVRGTADSSRNSMRTSLRIGNINRRRSV